MKRTYFGLSFWLTILLAIFVFHSGLRAQSRRSREFRKAYVAPDEIVSMARSLPFSQAIAIFNELSKKYLGKVIVDPEERNTPIGIDIEKMPWMDAFELILRTNNLWYEEHKDYLKIISLGNPEKEEEAQKKVTFSTREVAISAVFFEADASKLRQAGFSWDLFRGRGTNLGLHLTAADNQNGLFQMDINPDLDFMDLMAVFKTLESDQLGEVIASPQITVRSNKEGRIQVGSDISITVRDFAGNAITQFFSTGSIIKVTPEVIPHDSIYFIHLNLKVERSNTGSSSLGLEIKKTFAETSVLLLDGEETIIGGLYVNEEKNSREGIPFLKDLPWWFFGLRYLFGFEQKSVVKKELLILLKAELVPTLEERLEARLRHQEQEPVLIRKRREERLRIQQLLKQLRKGK